MKENKNEETKEKISDNSIVPTGDKVSVTIFIVLFVLACVVVCAAVYFWTIKDTII